MFECDKVSVYEFICEGVCEYISEKIVNTLNFNTNRHNACSFHPNVRSESPPGGRSLPSFALSLQKLLCQHLSYLEDNHN